MNVHKTAIVYCFLQHMLAGQQESFPDHNWSKNFGKRRHFRGIFRGDGVIISDTDQLGALQWAAAVPVSCRYWCSNDPFCSIHCCRDYECISVICTTLLKLLLPVEKFLTPM